MNKDKSAQAVEVVIKPIGKCFTIVKDPNTFQDKKFRATIGTTIIPDFEEDTEEAIVKRLKKFDDDTLKVIFTITEMMRKQKEDEK